MLKEVVVGLTDADDVGLALIDRVFERLNEVSIRRRAGR